MCIVWQTLITYKSQTGTGSLKKHTNASVKRTATQDQTELDTFLLSASKSRSLSRNDDTLGSLSSQASTSIS